MQSLVMYKFLLFNFILEPSSSTDLCTSVKCYCFDCVNNVSDRMCYPVSNNLSMGITVSLNVGTIETNKTKLFQIFTNEII